MSLCLGGEPSRLPTLADRRNDLGNLPNLWIKKSLGDLGNRQSALTTDHPMTRIRRESLHKEAAEAGGGRPTTIIGHGSRLSDQKHTRTIQHCSLSVAITIRDHQQAHPSLICSLLRLEAEILPARRDRSRLIGVQRSPAPRPPPPPSPTSATSL